ncbi:hypothetical protein SARC_02276 [Sphaeroforma arctica JP610]|uniref:Uncharacterized protein n=1 Tax=Sphaeroforma arctica JP610 TaxID=667725 RepID=A0A0L0G9G7_9EUKA|nr:hypothetical protein SARC_02276 [Sphaeroforma arctica JP610]KNC85554.1 hypothetical protein SARC_02276 [Sphaeroforma arctica JP610]|eukprot:XP_014159456.1 hypothetical protein SARC_02276 [Sphaeroforma arctica JP610]
MNAHFQTCKAIAIGYALLCAAHLLDLITEIQGEIKILPLLKVLKGVVVSAFIAKSLTDGHQSFDSCTKTKGNDTDKLVNGLKNMDGALGKMKNGIFIMAAVTAVQAIQTMFE